MQELGAELLLVCSNVVAGRRRRRRAGRRAAARAGRARRRARAADRLRGARLGPPRRRLRARLADRRARRPSRARRLPGQLPHPLARLGSGRDRGRSPARSSSSCSWRMRRGWPWTCCSGAATTAASPARAPSTSRGFLAHVLAAGYAGPLSLEVFNDVFRAGRPASGRRSTRCARCSCSRASCRAAPALGGYAFVEVAGEGVEPLLQGLGFALTGRHRTKPVHLWEQGRSAWWSTHGDEPRVAALAVESTTRSARSAARRAAGAVLDRARGPGEADISAVAAPDGTSLFFCPPDEGWLDDFVPRPRPDDGPLTSIDHLALAQPSTRSTRRSCSTARVLGLEPSTASEELVSPDGLVRSRALTRDGVRLALNVPVLPGHGPPSCSTSRSPRPTSRRAVRAGARGAACRCSTIPDNYYDDLEARLGVDTDRAARARTALRPRRQRRRAAAGVPRHARARVLRAARARAAATRATAPPTHRSAWRHNDLTGGERWPHARHPSKPRWPAGSAACSSTTTSSSTARPPRWCSARCSSRSPTPRPATLLSFATYGVGYVARPIGAFFMGHLGDRHGRKRVLVLTADA